MAGDKSKIRRTIEALTEPLAPPQAREETTIRGIDAFVDELHDPPYSPAGIKTVLLAFAAHVKRQFSATLLAEKAAAERARDEAQQEVRHYHKRADGAFEMLKQAESQRVVLQAERDEAVTRAEGAERDLAFRDASPCTDPSCAKTRDAWRTWAALEADGDGADDVLRSTISERIASVTDELDGARDARTTLTAQLEEARKELDDTQAVVLELRDQIDEANTENLAEAAESQLAALRGALKSWDEATFNSCDEIAVVPEDLMASTVKLRSDVAAALSVSPVPPQTKDTP